MDFPVQIKQKLQDYFQPGGYLHDTYGMKSRKGQAAMINAICTALSVDKGALIEAPTGTGKTMSYLLPASEYLDMAREHGISKKVVLSTSSRVLQDQLDTKDFPLLQKMYPNNKYFVWKGAANYLCMNRLYSLISRTQPDVALKEEATKLWTHADKLSKLPNGSRTELPIHISDNLWNAICGSSPCCKSNADFCCHKRRAYARAVASDILCVNHNLNINTALHAGFVHPARPKKEHTLLIYDEAQELENALRLSLNSSFSFNNLLEIVLNIPTDAIRRDFRFRLQRLEDELTSKVKPDMDEIIITPETPDWQDFTMRLVMVMLEVAEYLKEEWRTSQRLEILSQDELDQEEIRYKRIEHSACLLYRNVTENPDTETLTLVREMGKPYLRLRPFTYEEQLQHIYSYSSLPPILTSATLFNSSTAVTLDRYALKPNQVIVEEVPSSFDYASTIRGVCFYNISDSSDPQQIVEPIKNLLLLSAGNALVLFTAYNTMNEVAIQIDDWLTSLGYTLKVQSPQTPAADIIRHMKAHPNTVAFGNLGMWTGVDIKGTHLSQVILTKIPFSRQDAFAQAHDNYLLRKGFNPFYDRALIEAITRFRQGIGRLKRDEKDKGIISVLDPRFTTSRYAPIIHNKLPRFDWTSIKSDKDYPDIEETQEWLGVTPPTPPPPKAQTGSSYFTDEPYAPLDDDSVPF